MYDFIIIGGGASGMFCGINLPKKAKKMLIEGNSYLGSKILVSGGGRCNFTNINIDIEKNYVSNSIGFLHGVFHKYNNYDFMSFLKSNKIEYVVERLGKVYLKSGKAKNIVNLFEKLLIENNTQIVLSNYVNEIKFNNGIYYVITDKNTYSCKKLIISSGGKSYSQLGTKGFGFDIAKQFGLNIVGPYKGLCSIKLKENLSALKGSSFEGGIILQDNGKQIFKNYGNILITHFGVSGPAILDTSLWLGYYLINKQVLNIEKYLIENIKLTINIENGNITKKMKKYFQNNIEMSFDVENFKSRNEAKVTGGGIDIKEINNNFETKKIKGLYLIGEQLDITGYTGGYNLQFAWSSGYICAKNI